MVVRDALVLYGQVGKEGGEFESSLEKRILQEHKTIETVRKIPVL